jgi:hypothetical protein
VSRVDVTPVSEGVWRPHGGLALIRVDKAGDHPILAHILGPVLEILPH